jgi:hypothetical protein
MENKKPEALIKINGLEQIIEMLQIAEPEFRESLLKRIAQKDYTLAKKLLNEMRLAYPVA